MDSENAASMGSRNTCLILLLCALAFQPNSALAQANTSTASKPTLIVHARTSIADDGAPTLDLLDLQNYFVTALTDRRIANVASGAATQLVPAAGNNVYFLRLSVDSLDRAVRTKLDQHGREVPDPVFHVALSLTVLGPNGELGRTGSWRDHHLADTDDLWNGILPKRTGIYRTADDLADQFIAKATGGQFGPEFKNIQLPKPTPLERIQAFWKEVLASGKPGLIVGVVLMAILLAVLVGMLTHALYCYIVTGIRDVLHPHPPVPVARPVAPPRPAADPEKDKVLKDVIALAEKTGNFSDDWLRGEAQENLDVLLRDAETIYARHAERSVHKRGHDAAHKTVATYAAQRHGLDCKEIQNKLRRAQNLQHDLLLMAQKISRQRTNENSKPAQRPPSPPNPEVIEADRRAKARQQELDALEHDKQKKQKELEVERVDREIRDSRVDLKALSASPEARESDRLRERAQRAAQDKSAVELDAFETAAEAAEKKVNLARNKCICVFQDLDMRAGEKRARIQSILDSFGFRHDILPLSVQEFVEEGYREAEA